MDDKGVLFEMSGICPVTFYLPEFSTQECVKWNYLVNSSKEAVRNRYDMIIGREGPTPSLDTLVHSQPGKQECNDQTRYHGPLQNGWLTGQPWQATIQLSKAAVARTSCMDQHGQAHCLPSQGRSRSTHTTNATGILHSTCPNCSTSPRGPDWQAASCYWADGCARGTSCYRLTALELFLFLNFILLTI